jgi:multicomponent Na+:H+ antiporter subunit D
VPLTAGFISTWYLVIAALEVGGPLLAFVLLASSLLAGVYVWRVVEVVYFQEAPAESTASEAPASLLIPAWFLIGASLYFGVFTDWTGGVAETAARQLLAGTP